MTTPVDAVVAEFGAHLAALGWVEALHVGGSVATGDHHPATSDVDLVAVTRSGLDQQQVDRLRSLHQAVPAAHRLGCVYVPVALLAVPSHAHPTWTHGRLIERRLSGIGRAELLQSGRAVFGPQPRDTWPAMSDAEVRDAVDDELAGYWTWALRRPWLWLAPAHVDLAVTTMLRARHTLATGELVTKSEALSSPAARLLPDHLVGGVRARRSGQETRGSVVVLPLHAAQAWHLTRQTVATSRG